MHKPLFIFKKQYILFPLFLLLCQLGFIASVQAQITNSPYSRYGLGNLVNPNSARNFTMGGLGIAIYDGSTINRVNPASYADIRLTTLDVSVFGKYTNMRSGDSTNKWGTGGFESASMAFAGRRNFALVAGLAPYSTIGYNVVQRQSLMADTTQLDYTSIYSASGGLNQFYIGSGIKVLKRLSLGLNLTYAFGTTNFNWVNDFDNNSYQTTHIDKRVSLKGLLPQTGIQYGDTLKIRVKVDKKDEIDQEYKANEARLRTMRKEESDLLKEKERLNTSNKSTKKKLTKLLAEKSALEKGIREMMANESENEKEIGKMQDKAFRLDKKRKKLEREIRIPLKENAEAMAKLKSRRDRLQGKQAELMARKEAIGEDEITYSYKTKKVLVRLGGIFEPGVTLNGSRLVTFDNTDVTDTLSYIEEGQVKLPMKYGFGVTFAQRDKWMVGTEITLQDWSKFQFFGESRDFSSAMRINLGGEWTPDMFSNDFYKRISYRGGLYYQTTFLNIDGTPITEYGVSLGAGLPLGYFNPLSRNYSRVSLGLRWGTRGTTANDLLRESVLTFKLGVNLNDIWFIKRRVD